MPSLYEIAVEGDAVERLLLESEGELTPELEDRLDYLLRCGKDKLDNAAAVCRRLNASAETCKAEEDRLRARRVSFERQAEFLKSRMLLAVDAVFSGKLKTDHNTFTAQSAKPKVTVELAADVDISEMAKHSPEAVNVSYSLNVAAIKLAHSQGDPIPQGVAVCEYSGTRYLAVR